MRGRIRAPQAEVGGAQVTVWFPSWAPLALGPRGGGAAPRETGSEWKVNWLCVCRTLPGGRSEEKRALQRVARGSLGLC